MPIAKAYNPATSQWEPVIVGEQGDPGIVQSNVAPSNTGVLWLDTDDTSDALVIPAGGTAGQALTKINSTDYNTQWSGPYPASPNYIINGAFDIWQRGASSALGINNYIADRWGMNRGSYVAGATASRQQTSDTTNLPNIEYCIRVQRDSGNSATDSVVIWQSLENQNSNPLIGQTVTLSFWARKGANFSQASSNLNCQIQQSTGTDENINNKTGGSNILSQQNTLTTTWQRFTATGTVNAASKQLHVVFQYVPSGTAGANDYFEITGVQLEAGSVATPFRRHAPSLQGELAACQRYYYRIFPNATAKAIGIVTASTTTTGSAYGFFPVKMRIAPTALEQSGTATNYGVNFGTTINLSAVPSHQANTTNEMWAVGWTIASGATQGWAGRLVATPETGDSAYLGWSAEL